MVNRMSKDVAERIQQRIQLHPHATASEIAASLELDGIRVQAAEVREVMTRTEHAREQIDGVCFETR